MRLLAVTGMRLGEALGLKWKDISFEHGTIFINRAACTRTRELKDEPKTPNSIRTIPIDEETMSLLKEHFRKTVGNNKIYPLKTKEYLVFSENGHVLSDDAVRKTVNRILKKAGLDHIRVHDLRHTAASLLIDNGYALPIVALLLGHGSPNTTSRIYTHAVRRGVNVVDALKNIEQQNGCQTNRQTNEL